MAIKSTGLSTPGIRSEFFGIYNPMDKLALYQRLAMRIPSTRDQETHRWLGAVPQMREWGDGRDAKGLGKFSQNIVNGKFELTLEVDRDEVSDDQTGQIMQRVRQMAERAGSHKDYLLGAAIDAGATTGSNAYDGLTFYNDNHTSGASGNQDNDLTYAAATGTVPTVAEAQGAIEQGIAAMMGFKDDQGEPMWDGTTKGLIAVVHPSNYFTFRTAMQAAIIAQTSNVDYGLAEVIAFPRLTTDPKIFHLFKADGAVRPFIFQDREPLEFKALDGMDTEEQFKTEKFLYGVRARYKLAYGAWQMAVRTTFT